MTKDELIRLMEPLTGDTEICVEEYHDEISRHAPFKIHSGAYRMMADGEGIVMLTPGKAMPGRIRPLPEKSAGFTFIEFMIILAILGILVVLGFSLRESIRENERWNTFRVEHRCKIVGQMDGSTSTGVAPVIGGKGGVGVVVVSTPGKTGWQCDDGVTYWRKK